MRRYEIGTLRFPWKANIRYADLSPKESNRGYRVIGGNRGDVRFNGFETDDNGTELGGVRLFSALDLTKDEALEIATEIVGECYESIGTECVEHS